MRAHTSRSTSASACSTGARQPLLHGQRRGRPHHVAHTSHAEQLDDVPPYGPAGRGRDRIFSAVTAGAIALERQLRRHVRGDVAPEGEIRSSVVSSQGVHDRYSSIVRSRRAPSPGAGHAGRRGRGPRPRGGDVLDDMGRRRAVTAEPRGWWMRPAGGPGHRQGPGGRPRPAADQVDHLRHVAANSSAASGPAVPVPRGQQRARVPRAGDEP